MYKIKVYDVDENDNLVLLPDSGARFSYHKDAQMFMMTSMFDAMQVLLQISHENQIFENGFTPHLNYFVGGQKIDGVIRRWNIPADVQGELVTLYQIVWANESDVDKYNKQLKDTFGDELTLWICSTESEDEADDDDVVMYYFTGATISESDYFKSPEIAYYAACDYLNGLMD